jgi:hypothetical protein
VAEAEIPADGGPGRTAQRTADQLAVALEEVGFDVGRAFPLLRDGVDRQGRPVIELGRVSEQVAGQLCDVLTRAARHGITVAGEDEEPDPADALVEDDPEAGN